MTYKVAILGAGPAGLLAAHAANLSGWDFKVFSPKVPSKISGAQYLHEPIDGLNLKEPDGVISYAKVGEAEGYADKVYGDPNYGTSWSKFPVGDHDAWVLQDTYEKLRQMYWGSVFDTVVSRGEVGRLCAKFDLVLSSVPAQVLCGNPVDHVFKGQKVFIADVSLNAMDNFIVYNGRSEDDWYRSSCLFGHNSTEWSDHRPHPVGSGVLVGTKPLSTNCNCHLVHSNYRRIGRFGKWQKGVLVNDAFREARAVMNSYPATDGDRAEGCG